jgi:hypothetical protein
MKVAWLTHHVPRGHSEDWLLPGGVGGAEMTDAAMIRQAPAGIDIQVIGPGEWRQAFDFDRVIITGTDLLPDEALIGLGEVKPVVWVHHEQFPTEARRTLFEHADPFITMSQAHSELEARRFGVVSEWCHGHIDLPELQGERTEEALWAARQHPQKGLLPARRWAREKGFYLTELSNVDRSIVLQAMTEHEWFVFLPQGFDSCPRTLIEAEAYGCKIHTNGYAGRRDPGDFWEVMAAQAPKFWSYL